MTRNEKIMALLNEGLSYSEVAKKMNVTRNCVAGVHYRNRARRPNNENANLLKILKSTIRRSESGNVRFFISATIDVDGNIESHIAGKATEYEASRSIEGIIKSIAGTISQAKEDAAKKYEGNEK